MLTQALGKHFDICWGCWLILWFAGTSFLYSGGVLGGKVFEENEQVDGTVATVDAMVACQLMHPCWPEVSARV